MRPFSFEINMSDVIGSPKIVLEGDARSVVAAAKAAESALGNMSTEAQSQYQKLDAAEKRRVQSLLRQAETIGMTKEEIVKYNAQNKLTGPLLDEVNKKLEISRQRMKAAANAQTDFGISAKQTAAAIRGVPAQITDIAVSLQGGQRPLTVLLQQGGQLKDMFGGVAPAAKALSTQLMAMVNPLTVTAVASAALFAAWSQGREEMAGFERAMVSTGNYANISKEQVASFAQELDALPGITQSFASSVVNSVIGTGKFVGDEVKQVAEAAVLLEKSTGQAASETIKAFEEIKKDPVDALLKLNETQHFVTEEQLDFIRALQDTGDTARAEAEATRIYADELSKRAEQMKTSVSGLNAAWTGLKHAAAEAWDAMLDVGRQGTKANQAADAMLSVMPGIGSTYNYLKSLGAKDNKAASNSSVRADAVDTKAYKKKLEQEKEVAKAAEEFDRLKTASLTRQQRLEADIAKIREVGLKAGKSEAEIQKQITAARSKFADSEKKSAKSGKAAKTDPADSIINRLKQQIALNQEALKVDESLTQSDRMRIQVELELERIAGKTSAAKSSQIKAMAQEVVETGALVEKKKEEAKVREQLNRLMAQIRKDEEVQQQQNDADLAGRRVSGQELERMNRQLEIQRWYAEELRTLRDSGVAADSEAYKQQEAALAESLTRRLEAESVYQEKLREIQGDGTVGMQKAINDYVETSKDSAALMENFWGSAIKNTEDTLLNLYQTGEDGIKQLVETIIKEWARVQLVKGIGAGLEGMSGGSGQGFWASFLSGFSKNANGGVYQSPSLSQYSGGVYSTPQFFREGGGKMFANGGSVFGEAGPEAIMPLKRIGSKLGVQAVTGKTQVVVNNYGNNKIETEEQTETAPDGSQMKKLIISVVAGDMASGGKTAKALKSRYGLKERV